MNVTHHVSKTKFSISQIRNERKSVFKVDRRYEFNAPKFYDFSHTVEETLDENWIDPWFSIDHDRSTLILNDIHEKKDKPEMKRELPRGNKGNLPQNDTKKRNVNCLLLMLNVVCSISLKLERLR